MKQLLVKLEANYRNNNTELDDIQDKQNDNVQTEEVINAIHIWFSRYNQQQQTQQHQQEQQEQQQMLLTKGFLLDESVDCLNMLQLVNPHDITDYLKQLLDFIYKFRLGNNKIMHMK